MEISKRVITILQPDASVEVPIGFKPTTINIDGHKVQGWVWGASEKPEYCVVYGMNEAGEKNFYRYDMKDSERTIQRYFADPAASDTVSTDVFNNLADQYDSIRDDFNLFKILLAVTVAIALVLLIILLVVVMNKKGKDGDPGGDGTPGSRGSRAKAAAKKKNQIPSEDSEGYQDYKEDGYGEEDSYGIYVDYVTINGGTVTAEGGTAEVKSAGIDIVALTISGGTVTATGNTSGVYAVYEDGEITVSPQGDQQIAVLLGESETAAAAIEGSPFASETGITDQVNNFGKYFHSEVVGTTPPEPEEFTITFDAAGGTTPASQTTVDGKLTSLPTSTRDGYDFLGWYTAGGDRVTTDTVFAADTTLYARWAEQAGPGDDDKPPYIPPQPTGPNTGNSEGWDDIQEEISQAQPGDTITIDMSGETEVPAEMFEEVAGKDVTVELDLGGGITWTVNGQDVPTDTSLSDLDLGVDLGTNGISADVINTVTGAYGTVQMTLAHDGAFGFTLTLTAPLGRENAGYWANLYHYDEEAEALTFETSAQIADDGSVALRMSHASQYAIVIDDKNHGENAGQPTLNTQDHDAYLLGYEDGTVRPEGSITRAEVATIFFRLLTDESRDKFWSQTNDYTDVPADAWYNNAVSTLSNAGILDGYEDGTFRPDGNITRAEFATITARFLEASYDGGNRFPDIDGHWAAEYINEAANAGIVDGYEDGTFRPQQNITRAEAVTMVNRTVDRHPDADHLLDNMVTWPDNPESAWYYAQIQEATNAHAYTMHTDQEDAPYEIWTELLPNRD